MTESVNNVRRQISNHVKGINAALTKARNAKNGLAANVQSSINTNHVQKIVNLKSKANKLKAKAAGNFGISALIHFRNGVAALRAHANKHATNAHTKRNNASGAMRQTPSGLRRRGGAAGSGQSPNAGNNGGQN